MLQWICDVAELAGHEKLAWDMVIEKATKLRSQGILYFCLALAVDLLGASVPQEIRRRMNADPQVRALMDLAIERLFREEEGQDFDPRQPVLRKHFFSLRTKEFVPLLASWSWTMLYEIGSLNSWLRLARFMSNILRNDSS